MYRDESTVTHAELRRSVRNNLEHQLRHLARAQPLDLSAPRLTGRERAEQGAPLAEVLQSFRIGGSFVWLQLLESARGSGQRSLDALLDTATDIFAMADDYALAVTDSYRATMGRALIAADRRRSVLVEVLLEGPSAENQTAWEIATLLDMPFDGAFLVVVAETPELGEPATGARGPAACRRGRVSLAKAGGVRGRRAVLWPAQHGRADP